MAEVAKPEARRRKKRPAPVSAPGPNKRGIRPWMIIVGIAGAFLGALELYAPAMHGSFLFDDLALPVNQYLADAPLIFWFKGVRPLLMITYWANYHLSGRAPYSYHLVNVLIHAANTCLVFWILLRLLAWSRWSEKESRWAALLGAVLFLVHPLQTESVSYIAGRSESLAALFMLAAYAVFVYRRGPGVSWREAVVVLVLFGLAVASKENAVALAGWLVLTDLFWPGDGWLRQLQRNRRLYGLMIPLGLVALAGVARVLATSKSAGFSIAGLTWYDYALTQARALFSYVELFLAPWQLSVDHDFAISHSPMEHGAVFFVALLAVLVGVAISWRKRFPLAGFGLLMWLVLLAPTSSIVPLRDVFVERRMYVPMVGLMLIGCEALHRWRRHQVLAASLAGVLVLGNAWLTYRRNELWGDPPRLWMEAIDNSPAKFRPYIDLASASIADRHCEASLPYLQRAESRFPGNVRVIESYGRLLECVGRREEALAQLERAAAIDPHSSWVYQWIGLLYGEMGRIDEAGRALHHAVELDYKSASAHDALALWYESTQQNSAALAEYRLSINQDSTDKVAKNAIARLESSGVR